MQISNEVLAELSAATISVDGRRLILTRQVDRKLYVAINKVIEALGGKWSHPTNAHVFGDNARDRLEAALVATHAQIAEARTRCAIAYNAPARGQGRAVNAIARARTIVRRAAAAVKNPATKAWLAADGRGTWEAAAIELLDKTADKARELELPAERVDEEIANELAYRALNASLEHARRRGR